MDRSALHASPTRYEIAAWILAGLALLFVLYLHLLPALLAGLLVYELVHILVPRLKIVRLGHKWTKVLAVALLAVIVVTLLTAAIVGLLALLRSDTGSSGGLLRQMAEILENTRSRLPEWAVVNLPPNAEALKDTVVSWLREHARELQRVGTEAGRAFAHILIGMIVGSLVALREVIVDEDMRPLARALRERMRRLGEAFRRVVFAQVRISALNTVLTAIYLVFVLPHFGVNLPLTKTMIAITFLAGLLPVVGNLISNTVIVIVSLGKSAYVALGSLAFLIVIHKLEYFVNARIIGSQIHSRAWELLTVMLVMEAAFGLVGVVAAPIYYAYLKDELSSRGLV